MQILAAAFICLGLVTAVPAVSAAEPEVMVITPQAYDKILKYLLVSPSDVTLYKKIFRAQAKGNFNDAAELTEDLENHILLGHVLAEYKIPICLRQ